MLIALLRFGPALLIGLGAVPAVILREILQRRRYRTTGFVALTKAGGGLQPADVAMLTVEPIGFAIAVAHAIAPSALHDALGLPIGVPELARLAGILLSAAGVFVMVLAQFQMGRSWRIGIEAAAREGLVTGGLFRFSRNPIFVALLAVATGLTITLANWGILMVTVVMAIVFRVQAGREESYLLRTYGDDYRAYADRVGRFLPWFGRLS